MELFEARKVNVRLRVAAQCAGQRFCLSYRDGHRRLGRGLQVDMKVMCLRVVVPRVGQVSSDPRVRP